VQPGDTLSGIAKDVLGSSSKWPSVYQENRDVVGGNPNLIYAGEKLTVDPPAAYTGRHRKADATSPSSVASATGAAAAVSVPVAAGSVTQNLVTIAKFLVQHGYSHAAAAGVAGDVAGESTGNPESVGSGGGGIIGWTPLPAGLVTGNPSADLQSQLSALLVYNQQWAQFLPALNAATDPVTAGDIYSRDFERPAVLYSDTRPSVAQAVYGQL
jgi:hypothetical protein